MVKFESICNCKRKLKVYRVVFSLLSFTLGSTAETVDPIKQSNSLEEFKKLHEIIARCNIRNQAFYLSKKINAIDKLPQNLKEIIEDIQNEISNCRNFKEGKEYLSVGKNSKITACLRQDEKNKSNIIKEIEEKKVKFDDNKIEESILGYKNALVKEIEEGIYNGNYLPLLSSLPECLFIKDSHVPNTFVCAFSFKMRDGKRVDVFVGDKEKIDNQDEIEVDIKEIKDEKEIEAGVAFKSGKENEKDDYFKNAFLVQTAALGGAIPEEKMGNIKNLLADWYNHSEQKSFLKLRNVEFINSIDKYIEEEKSVSEIVCHGNTIRDMCPNCRATLVAHERLTIRKARGDKKLPDSFLCALQNRLTKDKKMPRVTCVISSFVEYGKRSEDSSWSTTPQVGLLDSSCTAPAGICSGFVNQFAFSEKDFLEMLIPVLSAFIPNDAYTDCWKGGVKADTTLKMIVETLCSRLITLKVHEVVKGGRCTI